MHQAGIREPHWTNSRNKSVSEANLLGIDARDARPHRAQYSNRRNSVAEYAPDGDHQRLASYSLLGPRQVKYVIERNVQPRRKNK